MSQVLEGDSQGTDIESTRGQAQGLPLHFGKSPKELTHQDAIALTALAQPWDINHKHMV